MPAIAADVKFLVKVGQSKGYQVSDPAIAVQCGAADLVDEAGPEATLWIGEREAPWDVEDAAFRLARDGHITIWAFYGDKPGRSALVCVYEPEPEPELELTPEFLAAADVEAECGATAGDPAASVSSPYVLAPATVTPAKSAACHSEQQLQEARSRGQFAAELRAQTSGVRFSKRMFWAKRSLSKKQTEEAAAPFHADAKMLAASRKLLDTKNPAYLAVTNVLGRARRLWNTMSVDYPVSGIRLIRRSLIPVFEEQMQTLVKELAEKLKALNEEYPALKTAAREQLGDLYDPQDYPETLLGLFEIAWDYPSVEPPNHLKELHPEIYEQQQKLVAARFEEAIRLHEEAFAGELKGLVSHLVERLTGTDEAGKPVRLAATAVTNVREFFEKFRETAIHSSPELDELILHAEKALEGVDPNELRKDAAKRGAIAADMQSVAVILDGMLVARPGRAITLED